MTTLESEPLRLTAAGDAKPAWITLLTTEHYNLQTQRAATISEANGRASIFLGALSAGLVALGFQGIDGGRSAGKTTFEVLVLSSLAFLGVVTYLRCVELSIDDWQFSLRISSLRAAYRQLIPQLAPLLTAAVGNEQFVAMLTARRQRFQLMLSVAGSIGIVTSIVAGADCGVLVYGVHCPLGAAIGAGAVTCAAAITATHRFQRARWAGATAIVEPVIAPTAGASP